MNTLFKTFLSMSFSGACLILLLFLGKRLWRNKISRQWQYYIWLVVVLRLMCPFGAEISVKNGLIQSIGRTVVRAISAVQVEDYTAQTEATEVQAGGCTAQTEDYTVQTETPAAQTGKADRGSQKLTKAVDEKRRNGEGLENDREAPAVLRRFAAFLAEYGGLLWLIVAFAMLLRKVTVYQNFVSYVRAGAEPVSDLARLDGLSLAAKEAGVAKPVELCVNPLVSSPLVIGFFRPVIVLPGTELSGEEFRYIVLHELTHYRRRDALYKWLVQIAVCLHWFNPLVYLMSREITAACEFSCDEAVLKKVGYDSAGDYGQTLLDAMAAAGKYRESLCALTLSENKRVLKERLEAVMNLKGMNLNRGRSRMVRILTAALTGCVVFGASFLLSDPVTAKASDASQAQQFYEAGSLPLFGLAFSRLDEEAQGEWLARIYEEGEIAFFSVGVSQLAVDSPLIGEFAEKFYEDGAVSFFSVLSDRMSGETLEAWLERALEDETVSAGFQAMLFANTEKDEKFDAWEEALWEQQLAEYAAFGVTREGKTYYYQGQTVGVFLDQRPDSAFYTLDIDPAGTVHIRVLRGKDGQVTGIAYMTEKEAEELFED